MNQGHHAARPALSLLTVLVMAMFVAPPAGAQTSTCNYLGSGQAGTPWTTIASGVTIIDGGYVDGWASKWCSIGHLTVEGGGALYNGRVANGTSSGITEFQNGFILASGQPTDSSLTNYGTVQNGAYGSFINNVALVNFNVLSNLGTMSNTAISGLIHNTAAVTFANNGVLNNAGTIQNDAFGRFDNRGTLNNGSYVENSGAMLNAGSLNNTGTVLVTVGGTLSHGTPGAPDVNVGFVNQGSLQIGGRMDSFARLTNSGGILISPGGVLNHNTGDAMFSSIGSISNYGSLNLAGNESHFSNSGRLDNFGTLISADLGAIRGVLANMGSGFITNNGTAVVDSQSFSNFGIVQNIGSFTVRRDLLNDGSIYNQSLVFGSTVVAMGRLQVDGNLTNSGYIENSGLLVSSGTFFNAANRTVAILPRGSLLLHGGLTNEGSIANEGTVSQIVGGAAGVGTGEYRQTAAGALTHVNANSILSVGAVARFEGGALQGAGTFRAGIVQILGGTVVSPELTIDGSVQRTRPSFVALAIPRAMDAAALTIDGDLDMSGGTLLLDIAGTGAGEFDVLHVTGRATFSAGILMLEFADGFVPMQGDHWQLLVADGGIAGLSTLHTSYEGLPAGYQFDIQLGDSGVEVTLVDIAAVPEPGSLAMFAAGVGVLLLLQRRRGGLHPFAQGN